MNCVCPGPIEGELIEQVMDIMHMQAEGHSECKLKPKLSQTQSVATDTLVNADIARVDYS